MTPKSVFVVVGQTGEYSDRTDWYVAAYLNREDADWHADQAMIAAKHLFRWSDGDGAIWRHSQEPNKPINPFDPDMRQDYTGTDYYVAEVPLLTERPEPSTSQLK